MSTRVAVVGAGITGTLAAHHLAAEPSVGSVLLLDAEDVGARSSTQTAGNIHLQLSYTAIRDGEDVFARHARVRPLNDDADGRWLELVESIDGVRAARNGGVVVAETDADVVMLRRKVELEQRAGFTTEFVDGAELRALVPEVSTDVLGASWHAGEGYVDARTTCASVAREAALRGVEIETGWFIQRLEPCAAGWRIIGAGGRTVEVDAVVVVVGAWTEELLGRCGGHVPMHVEALTMTVTDHAPRLMERLVMHTSRPLSVKQVGSGNVMIGGGRPGRLVDDVSDPMRWHTEPDLSSVRAGMADAVRVVPATAGLRVVRSWTGILGSPVDDLPVVGEVPGLPGVVVAVAGHTGWTLAPTCARAAADLVVGRRPAVDLEPFSPARFVTGAVGGLGTSGST